MEDLNYLLKCEQMELLREQHAACSTSRAAHRVRAQGYGRRIREHHHPYRSGAVMSGAAFAPYPFGGEGRHA